MNRLFVVLVGFCAIIHLISSSDLEEWTTFKSKYSKTYQNETEENHRMTVFLENKNIIAEHNQLFEKGLVTYEMGLNKYSDLTADEFRSRMNGYKMSPSVGSSLAKMHTTTKKTTHHPNLPKSIDWRDAGAVSSVKDQELCGSCWAFAATGAVEGQHFLKNCGSLTELSVQNLVDCCSDKYGNNGCEGGVVDNAYQYIMDNGIEPEELYPFKGIDETCKFNAKSKANITVVGYKDISSCDEHELQHALATIGPISVAVQSSHDSFQHYKSGIYHEPKCDSFSVDHGVLAVGFGVDDDGQEYYIVKNSWGIHWGNKGYFKIARNKNNHCGIASIANYPLVSV